GVEEVEVCLSVVLYVRSTAPAASLTPTLTGLESARAQRSFFGACPSAYFTFALVIGAPFDQGGLGLLAPATPGRSTTINMRPAATNLRTRTDLPGTRHEGYALPRRPASSSARRRWVRPRGRLPGVGRRLVRRGPDGLEGRAPIP